MNKFILDYDKKTLQVVYDDETFNFDLNEGDVGDFWFSFTPKNANMLDINFSQEDENDEPIVVIYDLKVVNGNVEQGDELDVISECEIIGDYNNYFYPNTKKSGKVAKLVTVSFMTRVVVDANATEEEIIELCKSKFHDKVANDLSENIEDIYDDEEMPYNKSYDA